MSAEFEIEMRDAVVRRHAVRLGVITALTSRCEAEGPVVRHTVVPDRCMIRLLMSISGTESGDDGMVMVSAPNRPGNRSVLEAAALANYASQPTIERIPRPCRN